MWMKYVQLLKSGISLDHKTENLYGGKWSGEASVQGCG